MKLCSERGASFVDSLSNMAYLSSVKLDQHLAEYVAHAAPLEILSDYLHEMTHHNCMASHAGNALTLLWLRSTRADERSAAHKEADVAKVWSFQVLMRPWLEGIACYAQYDGVPGDSDVISAPMRNMQFDFFLGSSFHKSIGASRTAEQLMAAANEFLAGYRFSSPIVNEKANLLVSPLKVTTGGYLVGYLCVKAFREICAASSRLGEDTDFVIQYLTHFLMDDFGIVDVLLSDDDDDAVHAIRKIAEHLRARLMLIMSPEFARHVKSDMEYFEYMANRQLPTPASAPAALMQVPGSVFNDSSARSSSEKFDKALLEALHDPDQDLLVARTFFVLGGQTGTASFDSDGRSFIFSYGEDQTEVLQSLHEMPQGDYAAEMTQLLIPVMDLRVNSIAIDGRVLSIDIPDSCRGSNIESTLMNRAFHRDGMVSGMGSRQRKLLEGLESANRYDELRLELAKAQVEVEDVYRLLGLGYFSRDPEHWMDGVDLMTRTGAWTLLGERRDLVLELSILSIAQNNYRGWKALTERNGIDPVRMDEVSMGINPGAVGELLRIAAESGISFIVGATDDHPVMVRW
ncbi:MAG: hypothetical protein ACRDPY_04185 [Streptosporangiaceae bacterium]